MDYLGRKYGAMWVREQIEDDYHRAETREPKRFPPLSDRIYPGSYAPVIYAEGHRHVVDLMRYGAYPSAHIKDPSRYTTFNARRDNLKSPFWEPAFRQHHGFVVLQGFFEWVAVTDLLSAGVVTLEEVRREFARQAAERKAKILATGKPYKLTPTEKKDPIERKIIIQFQPQDQVDLLVPVIFSPAAFSADHPGLPSSAPTTASAIPPNASYLNEPHFGFAIVTDEPPPEILAAGHDRCPVLLTENRIEQWLHFSDKSPSQLDALLGQQERILMTHKLALAV
jgi:putative SOS response-associated peptidase YedK